MRGVPYNHGPVRDPRLGTGAAGRQVRGPFPIRQPLERALQLGTDGGPAPLQGFDSGGVNLLHGS